MEESWNLLLHHRRHHIHHADEQFHNQLFCFCNILYLKYLRQCWIRHNNNSHSGALEMERTGKGFQRPSWMTDFYLQPLYKGEARVGWVGWVEWGAYHATEIIKLSLADNSWQIKWGHQRLSSIFYSSKPQVLDQESLDVVIIWFRLSLIAKTAVIIEKRQAFYRELYKPVAADRIYSSLLIKKDENVPSIWCRCVHAHVHDS